MKDFIRQQIKEKIKGLPSEKKQEYSANITKKIIEKFGHLQTRHIYISMEDEVDTTGLITQLKKVGKNIFSPDDDVQTFSQNISLDIIIVPGRAFTHDGKRLGRGYGWYDRFLAQVKKTSHDRSTVVGICFPQQIVDDIPQESHDIIMDNVIT